MNKIMSRIFRSGFPAMAAVLITICAIASGAAFAAGDAIKDGSSSIRREAFFRIVHTNDVHSTLNGFVVQTPAGATEEVAGMARIASFFKASREAEPNTLCLSAGDSFQGTLFFNFFKGAAETETMNLAGYDASCPGNHEFDEGAEWFLKVVKPAAFPFVCSNLEFDPAVHPAAGDIVKPFVIREIAGVKVAITGSISKHLESLVGPSAIKGVRVLDPADALSALVPKLRAAADVVVVLSHNGYEADQAIASTVSGIDVIVGGHTHTRTEKVLTVNAPDKRPVFICQAFEKGEFAGELNLGFCFATRVLRVTGFRLARMDGSVPKDAETQKVIDRYAAAISDQVMKVIGSTVRPLVGERALVRSQETNLGDFLADMVLDHSKADMAVVNGGSIRAGIAKGDIRIADCINAFPFNQPVTTMKIHGKHIRAAFEYVAKMSTGRIPAKYKNEPQYRTVVHPDGRFEEIAVPSEYPKNTTLAGKFGGYLQVSRGMHVTYRDGAVAELTLNGAPIEDEKIYKFATSDFTANGGDGFTMFGEALEKPTSGNMTALFVEAVRAMKIIDVDVEGRIK